MKAFIAASNTSRKSLFAVLIASGMHFFSMAQQDTANNIFLADPTVFFSDGIYYMYGTVGRDAGQGFLVYTSPEKIQWKISTNNNGYALKKGDAFGTSNFWAPQVFQANKRFYMAYVADERIAIAESQSPAGPFIQRIKEPLAAPVKQIDPFVFIDDDGKKYLYHVRLTNGNRLFVAELTDDLTAIKPETLKECISATEPWENTQDSKWTVTEGPSMLKHKNLYYLVYTANDFRNPDYAVGYAIGTTPYGPWKKYTGNPILSRKNTGMNGTGHGDFLVDKKGGLSYVFHTHYSNHVVSPRRTAIISMEFSRDAPGSPDKLTLTKKKFSFLKQEYD